MEKMIRCFTVHLAQLTHLSKGTTCVDLELILCIRMRALYFWIQSLLNIHDSYYTGFDYSKIKIHKYPGTSVCTNCWQ